MGETAVGDAGGRPHRFFGLPRSRSGRWAGIWLAAFPVVLAVLLWTVAPDASDVILSALLLMTVATGIAALVEGAIAIVREGERSWIVFLALVPGTIVVWWAGAEILFPH